MIKEVKIFVYILLSILFIFFSIKYYISDKNKKLTNLSLLNYKNHKEIDKANLLILKSDTDLIIEYLDKESDKNKNNFSFWKLLKK